MVIPFDQQVTFLYVNDLETSTAFYGGTLSLPMVLDQGGCRIFQASQDGFIGICLCNKERLSDTDGLIVTLVTDDVDGWFVRLAAQGVQFVKPPTENAEYNIYHCFLRDPDGHQIEIQRFQDPRWPKPDS